MLHLTLELRNDIKAETRVKRHGWGIAMDTTIFFEGQDIPIIVVPMRYRETYNSKGLTAIIDPKDTAFETYGSFRVTDNRGDIILDYLPQTKKPSALPLIQLDKRNIKLHLTINDGHTIKPGEFNVTFKYQSLETPSVPFEIY
ncbi:MAG: hypothetical protein HQ510_09730 [Candidatus Marinimicrobia bacterium]|nr:hypothetical protein [Candidatus Neomarinimicrobiota bacterium]